VGVIVGVWICVGVLVLVWVEAVVAEGVLVDVDANVGVRVGG
jgi:hypothetical protein